MLFKKLCFSVLVCLSLAACKSSEERAAEYYQSGLQLMEDGDFDRALVEFRNSLAEDGSNLDAWRKLAEVQLEKGQRGGAYRSFLQIVERQPEDLDGRLALSEMAFAQRNWDEFVRHGTSATEIDPENVTVQAIDLGLKYRTASIDKDAPARDGLLIKAEALAEELPDNSILRQMRIDGYVTNQQYPEALKLLDEAIAAAPQDRSFYGIKIELLARMGDEAALEAELRNMVTAFPDEDGPKQALLRYLSSRERTDDAEVFIEELFAQATPEARNDNFLGLVQFINQNRGSEAALARIEEALAQEPENDFWRMLRASLNFDLGKRDEAIAELEAVLAAEDSSLTAEERQTTQINLAEMLTRSGNEVGARRLVEEILNETPDAVPALKLQASWLIQEDNTSAAITGLRTALDQAPEDAEAMKLMAEAYERGGDLELMQNFLSLAAETSGNAPEYATAYARNLIQNDNVRQAETTLIASLRNNPGNLNVLVLLGQVYLRLDDIARARQVVDALEKLDNQRAKILANELTSEIIARELGSEQALEYLTALATDPDDTSIAPKLNLLRAQLLAGNMEEAVAFAEKELAQDPENLLLRNALAIAYSAARDFEAADTEFSAMLEQNPKLPSVWLQLARVRTANGDADGATSTIDQGLEANPEASNLLWAKASYLEKSGDADGAIQIYEDIYARASDSIVVANNLASLLSTYRDDEESITRASVIARRLKDANIPAFQDTYGWILYLTGDVEGSLAYLEPAAAGLPNDPTVQFHLGMAYADLERTEDAQKQMQSALAAIGSLGDKTLADQIRTKAAELNAAPAE